ncbi:MAG: hypothetical protein GF308_00315 [Candidatus Heimdallarchaeota archaeon]|nr:hypothetical protein [Candidatus Heimdallarchaeota archaeon]
MWKKSSLPFLRGTRPLVMAHRGDSAQFPENSLQAYQEAYDLNVDVIETDLRMTKDKQIIFFHDAKVDRTTNGKGFVKNYTLHELKKMDQGYWFSVVENEQEIYPFRGKGLKIQSLEEILNRFPDMRFNMDIKDRDSLVPQVLAKKLKQLNAEQRVMIGSFHQRQLQRFRKHSSAPTSAGPLEVWRFRKKINKTLKKHPTIINDQNEDLQQKIFHHKLPFFALQIPLKVAFLNLIKTPSFIQLSQLCGIAIHIWTINNLNDMQRLLEWGVDGIFTDKPKILINLLEQINVY